MRTGVAQRLAASPVMVGAVTVLIAIVAVFLAYNANQGLPFVPTYRVLAEVDDANTLLPGNEVRIAGVRVGMVEDVTPTQKENGDVSATLELALDADVEPLPVDSTVLVRARSALGLKYLELNRGGSSRPVPPGETLEASTVEPVDIDQVLDTFDEPTRVAIQGNLVEFGNALAGRGPDLNEAIGELRTLLPPLERVMANLGDPETRLGRFFEALSAAAAEVAPVASEQADMFAALDTTFTALQSVARPYIQETISESPPTLELATRTLPRLRPFLDHSAALFADLEPGIEALRANAPTIASALETGAPVLADAPELNRELAPTARAVRRLNDDNQARDGIRRLSETVDVLDPTLSFLTPGQTVCNYPALFLRNAQSLLSQGNGTGTWQRFEVLAGLTGPNDESSPSSAPADVLHYNPYPNTAAPSQPRECEAGNEPYLDGQQVIGNVPGNQGTLTAEQD